MKVPEGLRRRLLAQAGRSDESGQPASDGRFCPVCLKGGLRPRCRYHDGCRPRAKHGSQRCQVEDPEHPGRLLTFDSRKEASRYAELWLLYLGGRISLPRRQVSFPLEVNGVCVGEYRADFVYEEPPGGTRVVEDVKSVHTRRLPLYRIKRKLMLALHKVEIRET